MPFLAGVSSPATLSLVDAGNEAGQFRIYGATIDATNFDDQRTAWEAVITAAMALVLGAKKREVYGTQTDFVYTQPTNGAAREIALLVQGSDVTTGQRLTAKLPTLNPAIPAYVENINAKDVIRLDTPASIQLLITNLNAFWINPYTGNGVAVRGLKVVRGGK